MDCLYTKCALCCVKWGAGRLPEVGNRLRSINRVVSLGLISLTTLMRMITKLWLGRKDEGGRRRAGGAAEGGGSVGRYGRHNGWAEGEAEPRAGKADGTEKLVGTWEAACLKRRRPFVCFDETSGGNRGLPAFNGPSRSDAPTEASPRSAFVTGSSHGERKHTHTRWHSRPHLRVGKRCSAYPFLENQEMCLCSHKTTKMAAVSMPGL